MTLIAGVCSVLISLLVTVAGMRDGRLIAVEARAQAAADAAALAAVAESAPFGAGAHRYQARRFAELNGAELVSCLCYPGATAVQVVVALRGTQARARAVLDPDLLMPAVGEGLHPTLARAVALLQQSSGGAVRVSSGFRTGAEQRQLWRSAVAAHGDPETADDWVARPGTSMHERGLAVDLSGDIRLAERLVIELGLPLYRPFPHEPWHFEVIGSRRSAPV